MSQNRTKAVSVVTTTKHTTAPRPTHQQLPSTSIRQAGQPPRVPPSNVGLPRQPPPLSNTRPPYQLPPPSGIGLPYQPPIPSNVHLAGPSYPPPYRVGLPYQPPIPSNRHQPPPLFVPGPTYQLPPSSGVRLPYQPVIASNAGIPNQPSRTVSTYRPPYSSVGLCHQPPVPSNGSLPHQPPPTSSAVPPYQPPPFCVGQPYRPPIPAGSKVDLPRQPPPTSSAVPSYQPPPSCVSQPYHPPIPAGSKVSQHSPLVSVDQQPLVSTTDSPASTSSNCATPQGKATEVVERSALPKQSEETITDVESSREEAEGSSVSTHRQIMDAPAPSRKESKSSELPVTFQQNEGKPVKVIFSDDEPDSDDQKSPLHPSSKQKVPPLNIDQSQSCDRIESDAEEDAIQDEYNIVQFDDDIEKKLLPESEPDELLQESSTDQNIDTVPYTEIGMELQEENSAQDEASALQTTDSRATAIDIETTDVPYTDIDEAILDNSQKENKVNDDSKKENKVNVVPEDLTFTENQDQIFATVIPDLFEGLNAKKDTDDNLLYKRDPSCCDDCMSICCQTASCNPSQLFKRRPRRVRRPPQSLQQMPQPFHKVQQPVQLAPQQDRVTVIVIHRKPELMTETLDQASNKGWIVFKNSIFPLMKDITRDVWVACELITVLIGLILSIATVSLDQNASFNIVHLVLAIISSILAIMDGYFSLKDCKSCKSCKEHYDKRKGEGDKNDKDTKDTVNVKENNQIEVSSCKTKCFSCCRSTSDILRAFLSEVLLYPLLICDLFEVITGRGYEGKNHTDRLGFALFLLSCISLVLYVYVVRIMILVGMVLSVRDSRTPKGYDKKTDQHNLHDPSIGRAALRYQIFFCIHVCLQMLAQVMMFIAIAAKIRYDNRHFYEPGNSDESIYASSYLWYMIIVGYITPIIGFLTFFLVTNSWTQEFPIGLFYDMITIWLMGSVDDFFEMKEKMKKQKEKIRKEQKPLDQVVKIMTHVQKKLGFSKERRAQLNHLLGGYFEVLQTDFQKFRNRNSSDKLLHPFKAPLIVITSAVYVGLQLGFIICAAVTVDETGTVTIQILNGGGWVFYYFVAVAVGAVANAYVFAVVGVWVTIITVVIITVAIIIALVCLCMCLSNSNNNNRN